MVNGYKECKMTVIELEHSQKKIGLGTGVDCNGEIVNFIEILDSYDNYTNFQRVFNHGTRIHPGQLFRKILGMDAEC